MNESNYLSKKSCNPGNTDLGSNLNLMKGRNFALTFSPRVPKTFLLTLLSFPDSSILPTPTDFMCRNQESFHTREK